MTDTNKEEIRIRPFWYSDIWLFPKLITVITTLDKDGRVNAAPYSHIMQYDVMHKNPSMILGFRQDSHTFMNICDTGEFVINCPSADYLDDMMDTARFYPAGVNELGHTRFTPIPSRKVSPPSIAECPQIAECTVQEIVRLEKSSGIVIANIEAIVMDEGLEAMGREDRIRAMNLPIGLGDEKRRYYYHTYIDRISCHELEDPPTAYQGAGAATTLEWDESATGHLMKIPPGVRQMIITKVEEYVREQGADVVTEELFAAMTREAGMDEEVMDRFRS
jgi:flavin reductase (DIM6/NTAB) family NADH-FMN oxidoreductase RutF